MILDSDQNWQEKLAIAVIWRALLDLDKVDRCGTKARNRIKYFESAKEFLANLRNNNWGYLAQNALNIPKIEEIARKAKFIG